MSQCHIPSLLVSLHLLSIKSGVVQPFCNISCYLGLFPLYLSDLLSIYTPRTNCHSSFDIRILIMYTLTEDKNICAPLIFFFCSHCVAFFSYKIKHIDCIKKLVSTEKSPAWKELCMIRDNFIDPDMKHFIIFTSISTIYFFIFFSSIIVAIHKNVLSLLLPIAYVPVSVIECTIDFFLIQGSTYLSMHPSTCFCHVLLCA